MQPATSIESQGSICLQISDLKAKVSEEGRAGLSPTAIYESAASSMDTKNTSSGQSVRPAKLLGRAPEKKLTLFALRLAVLEKAATGLGTLAFIWATVVLLGGLGITLDPSDFWIITIILLIEGTRIFSRSHELEWQHQTSWSISDVGISSFRLIRSSSHSLAKAVKACFRPIEAVRKHSMHQSREIVAESTNQVTRKNWNQQKQPTRIWNDSEVPLLPCALWIFSSRNISKLLYWLQLASALTCVVLSLTKLIKRNFGNVSKGDTDKRNREAGCLIFYSLALCEASAFLLEKAYWELNVIICKILDEVNMKLELGPTGIIAVRRFFYDAYSLCVNGSIFDGLKMDMVSFGMELLASDVADEQLMGAQILKTFAASPRFTDDTLQKIGINLSVMERLVEMLNWKDPQEEEIRKSAAEIVSLLASKKQNSLRVAGIAGAMESISSLLHISRYSSGAADEIPEKRIIFDSEAYGFWTFNHMGLTILRKLARDQDNCGKIGNTTGLLPKIIDCTHAGKGLLMQASATSSQIMTVKRSLQVVKMLASTAGATGKQLRKEISEIVFTISNIRDILRYGVRHPMLQKLGIEILKNLALEEDATERIGGTGGLLKELLNIFFAQGMPDIYNDVRNVAGEALAMLAFESKSNCMRILKLRVNGKLVEALEDPVLRVNSARILRNLCAYSRDECLQQLNDLITAGPMVLQAIMTEDTKLQEVMIGLAAHVFKFMTSEESTATFQTAGIKEKDLADKLVQILKDNQYPSLKVPRMRRFTLELAIWMMKDKKANIHIFKNLGLEMELEYMIETISDIESFNIFSGTVGLSRHSTTIHSLIETAMKLMTDT